MTEPISLPSIAGLDFRAFDPAEDYPGLVELILATSLHDNIDFLPTVEYLRNDHDHMEGLDPRQDLLIAEHDGLICAAAEATVETRDGRGSHHSEAWVAPAWRRLGVGRALLRWTEQRAAAVALVDGRAGPRELETWIDISQVGAAVLLEQEGYQVIRHGLRMIRDLALPIEPLDLPAGLEVRPVVEADHRTIWDADTEAFRDHWNSAQRTEADYEGWFSNPELNTDLWQVAWAGDEVAGAVMPSISPIENELLAIKRGWLEHVSVRRPWRRQGLASALIVAALLALRTAGMAEAALGVDADNLSGAVGIYERLGFRRTRTTVKYRKEF
jgi:mycothiol synthase